MIRKILCLAAVGLASTTCFAAKPICQSVIFDATNTTVPAVIKYSSNPGAGKQGKLNASVIVPSGNTVTVSKICGNGINQDYFVQVCGPSPSGLVCDDPWICTFAASGTTNYLFDSSDNVSGLTLNCSIPSK